MKCSRCGAELRDKARKCTVCGAKGNVLRSGEQMTGGSPGLYSIISLVLILVFVVTGAVAYIYGKITLCVISALQLALILTALLLKKKVTVLWLSRMHIIAFAGAVLLMFVYISHFNVVETEADTFNWNEIILKNILPEPESDKGNVYVNSAEALSVHIYKTSGLQYSKYISECEKKGFVTDAVKTDTGFSVYNNEGYFLNLEYDKKLQKMSLSLREPMELGKLVWPENGVGKLLPKVGSEVGKIESDDENGFVAYVGNTPFEQYNDYVLQCEKAGFDRDVVKTDKTFCAKNSSKYSLNLEYLGGNIFRITVYMPEYDVVIGVECEKNILFSKYDVKVFADGDELGTVSHGTTAGFTAILKKGEHTICFMSADDSSVTGEITEEIIKDGKLIYKIKCLRSEIYVK